MTKFILQSTPIIIAISALLLAISSAQMPAVIANSPNNTKPKELTHQAIKDTRTKEYDQTVINEESPFWRDPAWIPVLFTAGSILYTASGLVWKLHAEKQEALMIKQKTIEQAESEQDKVLAKQYVDACFDRALTRIEESMQLLNTKDAAILSKLVKIDSIVQVHVSLYRNLAKDVDGLDLALKKHDVAIDDIRFHIFNLTGFVQGVYPEYKPREKLRSGDRYSD